MCRKDLLLLKMRERWTLGFHQARTVPPGRNRTAGRAGRALIVSDP